ncbi:prepilin peptidase [Capillibacterium thermochitinicola]|nr:A24 family peptidase [Capillibacterium thermochitinicola]
MVEFSGILFALIVGVCIGSFLNVVIYRLPRGGSLLWPPSTCPACQHRLAAGDLVPVLSYIWLRGKCRYCQGPINITYPVVELIAGLTTVAWALRFDSQVSELWRLIVAYTMIVIAVIDFKTRLIPNCLTYPMILGGLVYQWAQNALGSALIGGLVGGGLLFLICLLYPKGMGMGDVKLLTFLGIFLGVDGVLRTLFWGSLSGVVLLFPLVWKGRIGRRQPVPFAPFLAVGAYVVLFF